MDAESCALSDLSMAPCEKPKAAPASDEIFLLIAAQRADGSFEPSDGMLGVVHIERALLDSEAKVLGGDFALAQRIVSTLAALLVLEEKFPDRRDEWKMLAEKAERWLEKQSVKVPAGFADLKSWARSEMKIPC